MQRKITFSLLLLLVYMASMSQLPTTRARERSNAGSESGPNGVKGCRNAYPMSQTDFLNALSTVKNEGNDETKLATANQIAGGNCLTTGQIAEICKIFAFEENKISFAKFAYDHCTEPQNYFKLNNIFGLSSSVDELSKYVQSKE